ncbi:DUF4625 domain-containing protein [Myroides sp. DW712]|uniref:DUF4625 domain-containing protein n=1 Tax=Myroides sp. DW712 TaxID=3389800 RepID=UPI003979BA80
MRKIQYLAVISMVSAFAFTSCSSDDSTDTQKPEVNLIAPKEGAKLEVGKDIHFDMEVSDNEGLGSYNVDIHNNFDGHGHSGENHTHAISTLAVDTKPFAYNKTWDLGGKKNDDVHHHEIIIAADATPGKYHFVVKVLDKAGNQTMVFRNIEIVPQGEGDGGDHDHDHDHDHDDHNHTH